MRSEIEGINPSAKPSSIGCVECLATGGWWLHLRRCAECGHIGCCDNSPSQHASKHNAATGHPITDPLTLIVSFYAFVEAFARHRGLNPDQPPNLRKVTETL